MPDYRIRPATLDDIEMLVHHRVAMFSDMGTPMDADARGTAFRDWVAEDAAGGHLSRLAGRDLDRRDRRRRRHHDPPLATRTAVDAATAWPSSTTSTPSRAHRRRGLARLVMEAIHAWCRARGDRARGPQRSREGQPLYESMGYRVARTPMMFLALMIVIGV